MRSISLRGILDLNREKRDAGWSGGVIVLSRESKSRFCGPNLVMMQVANESVIEGSVFPRVARRECRGEGGLLCVRERRKEWFVLEGPYASGWFSW